MLMQLKLAGHLDKVNGIVFGEMLDCVQTTNQGYTLQDVVTRIVGDLGVPVAFGSPVGPRYIGEHHASVRSAGATDGAGWTSDIERIGISGH